MNHRTTPIRWGRWAFTAAVLLGVSFSHVLSAQTPVQAIPFDDESSRVVVCENCGKEVSLTSANGQKCPHCGTLWDASGKIPIFAPPPQMPPDGEQPSPEPQAGPIEGNPAPNAVPVNAQPVARPQAPAPQAAAPDAGFLPPPVNGGAAPEFNMANMPLWMKGALFTGSLLILWYLFMYRR